MTADDDHGIPVFLTRWTGEDRRDGEDRDCRWCAALAGTLGTDTTGAACCEEVRDLPGAFAGRPARRADRVRAVMVPLAALTVPLALAAMAAA
ncbi:hypothetical protein [Streptomyces sp. NPDC093094]|uniref:hypothetical protein n=1 Tax=Streptomyces sp. NPDC093094 TaxID=3366026 RepID=UPI0037F80C74